MQATDVRMLNTAERLAPRKTKSKMKERNAGTSCFRGHHRHYALNMKKA